jgi:hypothetical protein
MPSRPSPCLTRVSAPQSCQDSYLLTCLLISRYMAQLNRAPTVAANRLKGMYNPLQGVCSAHTNGGQHQRCLVGVLKANVQNCPVDSKPLPIASVCSVQPWHADRPRTQLHSQCTRFTHHTTHQMPQVYACMPASQLRHMSTSACTSCDNAVPVVQSW